MTWIKICGLTSEDAVSAAVTAGADAIGFVFAPSKRQVTAQQAARIARGVPRSVLRVAVMQHPSQALVDEVCTVLEPDVLQTDASDLAGLRVPTHVQLLPVVRDGNDPMSPLPVRVLYEGKVSGAGETANWKAARTLAESTQLVLAGGLHARNVAAAIALVKPFGVDVSSGVESAPGVKDVRKIEEFISAVRKQ
jgi:phosphoribosylanthranilate isomerase